MASFWKNNPCVPTWTDFVKDWFNGQPSKLIDSTPPMRPLAQVFIRKATQEDLEQLPEFWSRWYSTTKSARCMVPMSHVTKMAQGDIFVCVRGDEVIGSIVRRWITGLHMREVRWPRAAIIDYFCIHPAHRSKGIGRALLTFLHNSTLYTEKCILPQLMMWEGLQPSIPPASVGLFLHRKCVKGTFTATEEGADVWNQLQRGKDIWNESCEYSGETSIWRVGQKEIAIWNTFHRSVPEGLLIGIVVGGSIADANAFSQASGHPFGILLMAGNPLGSEGWSIDSPYQWISYNTKMNFISYDFPGIFL
jgi:GNAT superfamily N-acetyltransferase